MVHLRVGRLEAGMILRGNVEIDPQLLRRTRQAQESRKKRREVRLERLDVSRDLLYQDSDNDSDVEMSFSLSSHTDTLPESGDVGGVVCPVCWREWYRVEGGLAVCGGCCVPVALPPGMDARALRAAIRRVLLLHADTAAAAAACVHIPNITHIFDGLHNTLICLCSACDYLNAVF